MAISIVNQTQNSDHWSDLTSEVTPTPGNWLVAVVGWRYNIPNQPPSMAVTDAPRNVWYLAATRNLQADTTTSFSGYDMSVQVWICPAVYYEGWTYDLISVSLQNSLGSDQSTYGVNIVEVGGMGNGFLTVDSISPYSAYGTGSITMAAPAAAANCLMVGAASVSTNYGSFSTTGTGWSSFANLVSTAPNWGLASAWREGSTTSSVTLTLGAGTADWTGVLVAFRTTGIVPTGPPGQNSDMPVVEQSIGFGYDLETPLARVWFTDQGWRYWGLNHKRGVQYELGQPQSEPTTLTLRNNDGTYSPRNVDSPPVITATGNGSTTTFLCATVDTTRLNISDAFRLSYSALNPNTGFESGATGWTAAGGTFTQPAVGTGHVGQIVPTGAATVTVESSHVAVTPGLYYSVRALLQNNVTRSCILRVNWYNSGGTLISSNDITRIITAGTLITYSGTFFAPAGAATGAVAPTMTGTPAGSNIMFMDEVSISPRNEFTAFQITNILVSGGTSVISFVEASGTGTAQVATRAGDVFTATPIDMYVPHRNLASWGGKRHYAAAGWIERWPQTWVNPAWGTVGALTVGALSTITGSQQSALAGEISRRKPSAWWPLNDAAGSPNATNVSGVTVGPLVVTATKAGGATGQSADFGSSTTEVDTDPQNFAQDTGVPGQRTTLFGSPGTGWAQHFDDTQPTPENGFIIPPGSTDLNNKKGYALVAQDSGYPSITGGITVWMSMVTTLADQDVMGNSNPTPTLWILRDTDPADGVGQGSVIKLSMGPLNTYPIVTRWDKSTHASTQTICTSMGQIFFSWVDIVVTFTQTSWVCYMSGDVAGSGSCNLVDSFSIIDAFGESDQFFSGNVCPGEFSNLVIFNRVLSAGEIRRMSYAARYGLGNSAEFTSNRTQRFLDTVNFKTGRLTSDATGQFIVDGQGTDATTVADAIDQVVNYEDGLWFEDAGGNIQIRPSGRYAEQHVRATLGGDVANGEIPYLGDVAADFDPTFLYDMISIVNTTQNIFSFIQNTSTSQFSAVNDRSIEKYNYRTYSRNTRVYPTSEHFVFYLAYWLLSQYATSKQRFRTLTIDPASNPDLWWFALTVEVGDLLLVRRDQLGAPPIDAVCVVLQVAVNSGPGSYRVTLTMAPQKPPALLLDDDPRGIAGFNYFTME
jgi:hypothetical protein